MGTVTHMAVKKTKKATASTRVLPAVKKTTSRRLRSVDDLLTTPQRRQLNSDLDRMAKLRRNAEATSGTLRLG